MRHRLPESRSASISIQIHRNRSCTRESRICAASRLSVSASAPPTRESGGIPGPQLLPQLRQHVLEPKHIPGRSIPARPARPTARKTSRASPFSCCNWRSTNSPVSVSSVAICCGTCESRPIIFIVRLLSSEPSSLRHAKSTRSKEPTPLSNHLAVQAGGFF